MLLGVRVPVFDQTACALTIRLVSRLTTGLAMMNHYLLLSFVPGRLETAIVWATQLGPVAVHRVGIALRDRVAAHGRPRGAGAS